MADKTRHAAYYIEETTYGDGLANLTPLHNRLRNTSLSISDGFASLISAEMRPDRQIASWRPGLRDVRGEIGFEFNPDSFRKLFQAALFAESTVSVANFTSALVSVTASLRKLTLSSGSFPVWIVGDRITITGFANAANNKTDAIVVSRSATEVVLRTTTYSGGLVAMTDEAAGQTVTITCSRRRLDAGITRKSFTLVREFEDMSPSPSNGKFQYFNGCEMGGFTLSMVMGQIITGSMPIVGSSVFDSQSWQPDSTFDNGSNADPFDVFSLSIEDPSNLVAPLTNVTELTMTLENGLNPRYALGSDAASGQASAGRSNLTGQIIAYFDDTELLELFRQRRPMDLTVTLGPDSDRRVQIRIPRLFFTSSDIPTDGEGPALVTLPFQAVMGTTLGTNIRMEFPV